MSMCIGTGSLELAGRQKSRGAFTMYSVLLCNFSAFNSLMARIVRNFDRIVNLRIEWMNWKIRKECRNESHSWISPTFSILKPIVFIPSSSHSFYLLSLLFINRIQFGTTYRCIIALCVYKMKGPANQVGGCWIRTQNQVIIQLIACLMRKCWLILMIGGSEGCEWMKNRSYWEFH